jgi:ATP-binding cassette subfamily B protein
MSNEDKRNTSPIRPRRGGGPHSMSMPVEKAKDFKGTLKRLGQYLKPDLIKLSFVVVFAIIATIFTIIAPNILGDVTTEIYKGFFSPFGIDKDAIIKLIQYLAFLYVLSAVFSYMQNFIMVGVTQNTVFRMRRDIKNKLIKLPLKYYDSKTHGEIMSRVTNDVDTVGSTMQQGMNNLVTAVVTIIGVLIMMLRISWIMTLVALLTLPLSILFIKPIIKRSQKYFKGQQKILGNLNGHIEEMYSGHQIIKAFGKEKESVETFNKINKELKNVAWKAAFMSGIIMPVINLINNIIYVLISVVGAVLFINGKIEFGNIQSFIQYVRLFSQPISNVASVSNMIQSTVAAAERVFELLDEKEESQQITTTQQFNDVQGDIDIEHLAFQYTPEKELIKDFNLHVNKGQTIAIVGPTGAGKTTLVNLLLRFYDSQKGDIKIDNKSIYKAHRDDVRQAFGMVLQDTWLFKGSIKDNIHYGKLDATDEEIERAAKIANVDHFIRTLKDGYDTIINEEGTNISQGQKQLITIARALLANPKILILDEATSSVDTRTESYIQNAMLKLMEGRTNFVIAHRLSTIKNASNILVMNDGDIIETGNHQQLMEKKGFYYNLYNSQFNNPVD